MERPLNNVLSFGVILPVLAQLLICSTFQLLSLALLKRQPWYTAFDTSAPGAQLLDVSFSESRPETGVIFIISCWQVGGAGALSWGVRT